MLAFIFGKNWALSLAELMSYFEKEGITWTFVDLTKKALIIESDTVPDIGQLGGTLKIVNIDRSFEFKDLAKQDFGDYVNWPISFYASHELFKGVKKIFPRFPKDGVFTHSDLFKRRLSEVCLVFGMKACYFGRTTTVSNPHDFRKRDTGRPMQRPELAIAPSRARILVNLSQASKSIMDPFCGVGTIGQEALLAGVPKIYLSDLDKRAVEWTKRNMEWSKKEYKKRPAVIVKTSDARVISDRVEAIATEPDLGPKMRYRPGKADAEQIIHYLTDMYRAFFRAAYGILEPGGRIAIVLPCINSKTGKVFVNKQFDGFEQVNLFGRIPREYWEYMKIRSGVLDEEREEGKSRVVVREFCVYRKV